MKMRFLIQLIKTNQIKKKIKSDKIDIGNSKEKKPEKKNTKPNEKKKKG